MDFIATYSLSVSSPFNITVSKQVAKNLPQNRKLHLAALHDKEDSTDVFVFIQLHRLPLYIPEALQIHR